MLEKNIDLLRGLSEIISRETGYNLIICKEGGVIIEATLKERIGRVHDIARRIIAGEMDEYIVTKEDEEDEEEDDAEEEAAAGLGALFG